MILLLILAKKMNFCLNRTRSTFSYFFRLTYINHILGVNSKWLDQVLGSQSSTNAKYKTILIDRLLQIVHISGQLGKFDFLTHFFYFLQLYRAMSSTPKMFSFLKNLIFFNSKKLQSFLTQQAFKDH